MNCIEKKNLKISQRCFEGGWKVLDDYSTPLKEKIDDIVNMVTWLWYKSDSKNRFKIENKILNVLVVTNNFVEAKIVYFETLQRHLDYNLAKGMITKNKHSLLSKKIASMLSRLTGEMAYDITEH